MHRAQERQKRYADMDRAAAPDYQLGHFAWLSSRHIALNVVGTCKLLPGWQHSKHMSHKLVSQLWASVCGEVLSIARLHLTIPKLSVRLSG